MSQLRRREVHLVQLSHHDLGYTDLPSSVWREQDENLALALQYCTETDHYRETSRFRYTVEQAWSAL
jgi:hypothetical protein